MELRIVSGDNAEGTVLYVLPKGVLCYVNPECLIEKEESDGEGKCDCPDRRHL